MEKKPTLIETLTWIKGKLTEKGNYITLWKELFDHKEGSTQSKTLSFKFDDEGNIIVSTHYENYTFGTGYKYDIQTEYFLNVKSLHKVSLRVYKGDDTMKYDTGTASIILNSLNKECVFKENSIKNGKSSNVMTDSIIIPIIQDDELMEGMKKAFEYLIQNFGDYREPLKSSEPF